MNETPKPVVSSAPVSRRTVAKTAAWAAPAIALSAASPAFAASTQSAFIQFDFASYEVSPGGTMVITGKLVPASGATVPAGVGLEAAFVEGSGFSVVSPPTVKADNTFALTVKAAAGATESKLKVSSWSHPAFTEAFATLTLAAAPAASGAILFERTLYQVRQGATIEVTGTLEPKEGTAVPSDIELKAVVEGVGYALAEQAVVTGNTFKVKVANQDGAAGRVTIRSENYPSYSDDVTQLTVSDPGFVQAGYGMLPIAKGWVSTTGGSDDAVRWFRQAGTLTVTSGMLGKRWLDLRVSLQNGSAFTDNFTAEPFGIPEWTGSFPVPFPKLTLRTEARVVGGTALENQNAIGMRLGSATRTGSGALTGSADNPVAFWPSSDASGIPTADDTVYAFLPTSLPKGFDGRVEIVTTVARPDDGAMTKIGFIIDFRYP